MIDGLAIHIYEGGNNLSIHEEIVVTQADYTQLDKWTLPLYFTEAGHMQVNYTTQGLAKYRDFHRRMYDYCEQRGDGSIPGTHLLYLAQAGISMPLYGALYNINGPTPLVNELAGFPWNDEFETVEPPVTPGPPIEPPVAPPIAPPIEPTEPPQPPIAGEPTLVGLVLQYSTAVTWKQRLIFSDDSELLRERKGRLDGINPLKIDDVLGKPKSFFV